MSTSEKVRVAVNGFGVIGKRVAAAIARQDDMVLAGVADVSVDWRPRMAVRSGFRLFGATAEHADTMRHAGMDIAGTLSELIDQAEVVIDCTPKHVAARNVETYRRSGRKFILQGGEKHETTGHSFVAEANYASAVGRESTRVVSCNTTSIVRTLTALKRAGLLKHARGTLLRRATDPWESHQGGIMNSVDPELDVVTMAVKVPETLAHLHYWSVQMNRPASKDDVLEAFRGSSRIALINVKDGLNALNVVKEMLADIGRPHADLYEVALWADMLKVEGNELYYAYMVDNQAIVIPETIDAVRALMRLEAEPLASIGKTDTSLGIGSVTANG